MKIELIPVSSLLESGADYDFFESSNDINSDLYSLPVLSADTLVWGHSIVRSAEAKAEIYCRLIEGDAEENLVTALKAENRTDSYSWFEKEKILNFVADKNIDRENKSLLELIQHEGSFIPNTEKFKKLKTIIKNIVGSGILDLKTASRLEIFDDEIIERTAVIIKDFSFSRKRLFVNYMVELYKKGNSIRSDVISVLEKAEISENPFEYAASVRYPELKKLEKDFSVYTEKYLKGSGIQLKSPPNFEGGSYNVQFSFKSQKQLGRIIDRLEKVRETSDEIFRLL